jgi:murein DD-endopeptidase MepM/ murein hydrolase activator NlpD
MQNINKKSKYVLFLIGLLLLLCNISYSESIDEIKSKIDQTTNSKRQLEEEIIVLDKQLKDIGKETNTLQSAIKTVDATVKKNSLDIKLTENNIKGTELEIDRLSIEIDKKGQTIEENSGVMTQMIQETNRFDQMSFVELFLTYKDISDFWNESESILSVQKKLREKVSDTKNVREELKVSRTDTEVKKKQLILLRSELEDKKKVLEISKKEKASLLAETKNKESNYKKILADKVALKEAFDKELAQFESELKFAIDPKSIPSAGKGILNWPLDNVYITQKFGNTDFSKTAYASGFHSGVDFRASVGSKVKSSLTGIVKGIGNTDLVCPRASFGKWVLIEHNNGLSTLYAHLSLIKVSQGDKIYTGDVIGYSGNTGYSTGPHLHFGVYATDGIEISNYNFKSCSSANVKMPLLTKQGGYLDPLQYL